MRIATWNLERPRKGGEIKNALLLQRMREIDADIWVLTEASEAVFLPGYYAVATPPLDGYHRPGETSTAVLSRWPIIGEAPTWDPRLSVCAKVAAPSGTVHVYGTIIAYANDKGQSETSKRWVEHRRSIEKHRSDWLKLSQSHSSQTPLVVAGDFNQSRDGSGWYQDKFSVDLLSDVLRQSGLQCVTEQDFRKTQGLSRASIDHICLPEQLAGCVSKVAAWEGAVDGRAVSDHNGVYVQIDISR
ncbi:endonuclease/exonuclease/phosphatase family protein [uncultured Thiodictyon sp.]|uniref:endonuclease/exonuclease/phosphatase family protein n=1 Tax=uncultured Thiodictyon sp. TaxID=1846217 RepID=UPI0025F62D9A|nr:endonuclease/exonuclease/phosphatase family protein [uncultured Thiodictyon sp.]